MKAPCPHRSLSVSVGTTVETFCRDCGARIINFTVGAPRHLRVIDGGKKDG